MLCLLWCPHGVIHRPGNASKILFGWCLHLQWPKVYKPPCLSLYCIQYNLSIVWKNVFVFIGLFALLYFDLTVFNDFGNMRFCASGSSSEHKICNKTQKVHWSSVCDVLPLKLFCLICALACLSPAGGWDSPQPASSAQYVVL